MRIKLLIIILTIISLIPACSTPPKNPGDVFDIRKQAETHLELGSRDADRGSFETALLKLDEAMKLAVAVDDPGLRIRVGLSRGNVLFSLDRSKEAEEAWNGALGEAERVGNSELAVVSRIHIAWGKVLLTERADLPAAAQSVRDEVSRDMSVIKDRYYTAFAWTIIGLAEKELGRYEPAEAAVRRALDIHEKDLYFELAAHDWFRIASFRSIAGNQHGALQALESAIAFDRRVENSWGLASDWQGMGIVYRHMGNAEASRAAYLRAAEIFKAFGSSEAAAETLSRSESGL